VATPPLYHEEYTIAALSVGKPVYVEKPMALQEEACERMEQASSKYNTKLSVAHYRRALPLFMKIREAIGQEAVGKIRFVNVQLWQPAQSNMIANSSVNWRLDPSISGGGLFHDLSPHQLDLMLYYFGKVNTASGFSSNQGGLYNADDIVSGELVFDNGVVFNGLWCFTISADSARDICEIVGTEGIMSFSFFAKNELTLTYKGQKQLLQFENPVNIQQPMIERVVNYFLDKGPNPCSPGEARDVMRVMDAFTGRC
jgi:predicted dehydrogenase